MGDLADFERYFRDVIAWLRRKHLTGGRLVEIVIEEVGGEVTPQTPDPGTQSLGPPSPG